MAATAPASTGRPASRTFLVVGFVCATLFSGAVTLAVGVYNAKYQADRAERTAQIDRFVQSTADFKQLVVQFVAETDSGGLTTKTRAAIKANLLQQQSTLESAAVLVPPAMHQPIDQYMEALGRADQGIKDAAGPMHSRDFAQAAADIAAQRPRLLAALRSE